MIKDIMNSNETVLTNSKELEVLKEYFPSCFRSDASFDIERFKGYLNGKVAVKGEGYELKFLGKNYSRLLASVDSATVIIPDKEHNDKPANKDSQNIYISGDNLDGLKHLIKSYAHMVKCIYIDPPYNTGSDGFIYNDSFNFTAEELSVKLSIDEEQAMRILDLTQRGSASHSAWLMFMYPRLLLARDLLTEDGVIFISIDDNEQANLKLICDDIFGEENFIGMFIINASPSAIDYGHMAKMHEYALFYSKNSLKCMTSQLPDDEKSFKYTDVKGEFNIYPLYNGNIAFNPSTRPNLYYPFYVNPNQKLDDIFYEISLEKKSGWIEVYPVSTKKEGIPHVWRWGKEKAFQNLNGEIVGYCNEDGEYRIVQKSRLTKKTIRSLLMDKSMSSRRGTSEIDDLMGAKVFSFPKPTELISTFLTVGTYEEDECIIADFFSGSGTTAHSAMKLNARGDRKIKYLLVQLPEICAPSSVALSEGYKTIDEIGRERIVRAAAKINEEYPDTAADLGFKHFTLLEPTRVTLDKLENFVPEDQGMFLTNDILADFGTETVLTTWLVGDGYGFNASVQRIDFAGYTGYFIDKHLYLIDAGITKDAIAAIADRYETVGEFNPENIIIFGYSFVWTMTEELKINLARLEGTEKNLRINFDVRY